MKSIKSRYFGAWRHLVAAYVLFHIASLMVGAIPAPQEALNHRAWKHPGVQDQFAAWAQALGRLGLEIHPARLEEVVWDVFGAWMRCTQTAMTPFRSYQFYTGTSQLWSMFVAPDRYPNRLHVDIQDADGNWRPLYVARSREWAWRGAQLDHIRFRSAIYRYAWPHFNRTYKQFAAWLSALAAYDFPEASHLRVRMYQYRTSSPQEVREGRQPAGEFTRPLINVLSAYR